jgi:cytochrome P450
VYLDACLKEALRISGPVVLLARQTEQPVDLLGKAIPLGSKVVMFTYGVHRDPAYWERVEEFLPERFLPVRAPAAWAHALV